MGARHRSTGKDHGDKNQADDKGSADETVGYGELDGHDQHGGANQLHDRLAEADAEFFESHDEME